jgi:hypothetical protein
MLPVITGEVARQLKAFPAKKCEIDPAQIRLIRQFRSVIVVRTHHCGQVQCINN